MLNASSLRLTAYISEHLPWHGYYTPPETYTNYTDFNAAYLATNQRLYSNATLPVGTMLVVDEANNAQVARAVLTLHAQPMNLDDCFASSLIGLPGVIIYTRAHIQSICAALNNETTHRATNESCYHTHLLTYPFGRACLWLVPGDAISGRPDATDGVLTLYFSSAELRTPVFVWLVFFYRTGTTLFVWYRLYVHYYRHCLDIEARLRRCGHRRKMPPGEWSYEIVLGDPTAIVLMDAWVASLYYVDIWMHATMFGTATMQIQVGGDIWLMLRGVIYLARSVWFAYWGLCLVSYGLKRCKKQHVFSQVDPTLVAVAVTMFGPFISFLLSNVGLLARFYQWMFYCLVPTDLQSQAIEAALGWVAYTVSTLSIPVAYGLIAGYRRQRSYAVARYSFVRFNSVKNAAVFFVSQPLRVEPKLPARGGTLHHAMDSNPRLKRCPTISLRSTDCFLL